MWTFSVLDAYPGNSYVDLIGAHYYDVGAQFTTQRAFDKFLNSTRYGGPQGLNSLAPGGHRPRQAAGRARVGRVDAAARSRQTRTARSTSRACTRF